MRKEDKLLLLAELLDVKQDIDDKKRRDDFLNSEVMKNLRSFFKSEEEKSSPRYALLKNEYDYLISQEIPSLKVYFIYYARALYLWHIVENRRFLNPFLCFKNKNEVMLSRIAIEFDGKESYLGDVIMRENYSNDYKIEMVKKSIIEWRKEVCKVFLDPLELLLVKPKNLPYKKRVPLVKIAYGSLLLIFSLFLIFLFFLKDNIFAPIFVFDLKRAYFAYPLFALYIFVFLADFLFMISLAHRQYGMRKYFWAQDVLVDNPSKISKKINNTTEKLYHNILSCIKNKKELVGSCKAYSVLDQEYRALKYLLKINEKDKFLEEEDNLFPYEGVFLEIIIILIIYLLVCYFLIKGGIIA